MKTPDEFEKMAHLAVQRLLGGDALDLTAASVTMIRGAEQVIVALLRREHRAYVRLVKAQRRCYLAKRPFTEATKKRLAYVLACNDLLAAFTRYAKGKGEAMSELAECRENKDEECTWAHCPQVRDGEPERSGRGCLLWSEEEEGHP